jgi:hypothetical protein
VICLATPGVFTGTAAMFGRTLVKVCATACAGEQDVLIAETKKPLLAAASLNGSDGT